MASNQQSDWDEQESSNPVFSRLSILRTLSKRKIRITLAGILFALIGAAVVRMLPAIYLSEAVVLIDTQKIPEKFVTATVASDLEERIAAIRQTLLSGGELKKIIEEYGLYREAKKSHFEEEIIDMMRKDISITLESVGSGANNKRTADFRIGYQGPDPVLVMKVANRLTEVFVEQNVNTREGEAQGFSDFLETQLAGAKKQLDTLEASVSAYKLQHNGELPQQEQSLGNVLSRLQTELEANRDAINRAQQTRVILESNLDAMEATEGVQSRVWEQAQRPQESNDGAGPVAGGAPSAPEKKTSELLQEELELKRAKYSDEWPDVIRLKAELEKVKAIEEQRKTNRPVTVAGVSGPARSATRNAAQPVEPPEFERVRQQVAGIKAQIKGSNKELDDRKAEQVRILHDLDMYQRRVERLPIREQEMAQITRDYEMAKLNYKSLQDKKMAAGMGLDMEKRQQSERFTVVDRPTLPQKPIKPNRPALYAGAGAFGLVLGLLFGFAAELRQNVFLGEWELPAGTTVLARLPYIEVGASAKSSKPEPPRGWFGRRKALAGVAVMSLVELFLHRM